ncbi:MAG: glucose-6-phosphate dehydrogenase, partial [Myxococcaceae bacterium]
EKPFGRDLESARDLDRKLHAVIDEHQIYRIDHYLGKETVQNLLVLRFANGIFEPVWNHQYIENVQITVAEKLGVEDRGNYYDHAGVIRDMVQNHMLQLLTLIAMEPPSSLNAEPVRNEKVKALEAIRTVRPEDVVRGQYESYRSEPKVSPTSRTETYAALRLMMENWRWAGVPFYLRSGKKLKERMTEIVINFKKPPLRLFNEFGVEEVSSNRLIIDVQPDERIRLHFKAKVPGNAIKLKTVQLDFSYKDFGESTVATGYERLLFDVMMGDPTLFYREDMVEIAWKIATPILDLGEPHLYRQDSWGPEAADKLLGERGHSWVVPA